MKINKKVFFVAIISILLAILTWAFHGFFLPRERLFEIAYQRLSKELQATSSCDSLFNYQDLKQESYIVAGFSWLCLNEKGNSYYYAVDVLGNAQTQLFRLSLDESEKQEMLTKLKRVKRD